MQTLVVCLVAAINFGNSFCGNQQSPLQQEIEEYIKIDDSQFNFMFSVRQISSMVVPFLMPFMLDGLGMSYTCIILTLTSYIG